MRPRNVWDRVIDAVTLCIAILLLLHAVEPGTTEVPMPGDSGGTDDTEVVYPFA